MKIERMRWWHIEQAHAIELELFGETAWSAESFWGELAHVRQTRDYLVALDGDDVIAYAGSYLLGGDGDVQTIAVAATGQGRGVGKTLLAELLRRLEQRGCRQVLLEVRSDNAAAVTLYESVGFQRISRRHNYYGPGLDADIMRLRPLEVT